MNTQHKILFTNANYFPRVYLFPYFNLAALPPHSFPLTTSAAFTIDKASSSTQ